MAANPWNVKTPPATAAYAYLFKPRPADEPGKEPKYGVCLIWDKKDLPKLKEMTDKIQALAVKTFGPEAIKDLKNGKLKGWIRDGDVAHPDKKEFKGKLFINANSTRRPGVVDCNAQPVMGPEDAYSRCLVRASINLFSFTKGGNRGVSFGLQNLMVVEKRERMDGGRSAEEDFKEFAGEPQVGTEDEGSPLD